MSPCRNERVLVFSSVIISSLLEKKALLVFCVNRREVLSKLWCDRCDWHHISIIGIVAFLPTLLPQFSIQGKAVSPTFFSPISSWCFFKIFFQGKMY